MQAVFLLILFSLIVSLVGGIIFTGSKSVAELTSVRRESTSKFFERLDNMVNTVITPQNLRAGSPSLLAQGIAPYISNTESLAILASGRFPNAGVDAWGRDIVGVASQTLVTFYVGSNGSSVKVPVTSFALVSTGADGQLDATLQTALNQANTALKILSLDAGSGNDIVHTFNDEMAQRQAWEKIQDQVKIITDMAFSAYQQAYGVNPATAAFPDLSDATVRKTLGVQSAFDNIQKPLGESGSQLRVTSTLSAAKDMLTIQVDNDPTKPTPWEILYIRKLTQEGVE